MLAGAVTIIRGLGSYYSQNCSTTVLRGGFQYIQVVDSSKVRLL